LENQFQGLISFGLSRHPQSPQPYHVGTGDDPSLPHEGYKACHVIDNHYGSCPQEQDPPQRHFPSNILFHFPPDHVDRVYIGVCDWGMATRFIEEVPSVYGYPTKAEMEKNKKERYWVVPELFYVYSPTNSETAIECVQRKHLYMKESNAYSVGKLALRIWNDKWDPYLFKTVECGSIFLSKLIALIKRRSNKEAFISACSRHLIIPLYKMEFRDCSFRYVIWDGRFCLGRPIEM
jgi:hypothetical protein